MPKRLHVDGGTHLSLCSQNHSVYIYTHTSLLVLFSVMNSSNFEIYEQELATHISTIAHKIISMIETLICKLQQCKL